MDGHAASGESAGFVESDGVDAGEGFDGVEVLDEDFFLAEADGGEGEDARGEQDEPLWNHIDEGGDGAGDGGGGIGFGTKTGPEEEGADGDKRIANVFDDVVHEGEQLAVCGLDGLGFGLEFGDEVVGADAEDFGGDGARGEEGSRGEVVALSLDDAVLLAGDEGFVGFAGAVFDDAVEDDLVTEREDEQIAGLDGP